MYPGPLNKYTKSKPYYKKYLNKKTFVYPAQEAVYIKNPNDKGKITFQPKIINWSKRYLGRVARTHIKVNITIITFNENQIHPGIQYKKLISNIGNHPPKNKITNNEDIKIILEYSAKKKKAKVIDEYSTLNPETNSGSASGKSKGTLLVSASIHIKNIIHAGKRGIQK